MRVAVSRSRALANGISQATTATMGEVAEAVEDFNREGMVRVHGELWTAVSTAPVRAGQRLRIRKVDGLVIQVEPERE